MNFLREECPKNAKLIAIIGTSAVLGTLALDRLLLRKKSKKKYAPGAGPTGNGRWKLYHTHSFMSARCTWLIDEMGMQDDFEMVEYNPHTAGPREKYEYKTNVHPHGCVPAMVTSEGEAMIESTAICLYLAKLYGLCLPDKENETTYYNWSVYAAATGDSCIRTVYRQLYTVEEKDKDPKVLEINRQQCLEWVKSLESLLSDDRQFICTNGFTAVDAVVGYTVFWLSLIQDGTLLEEKPHTRKYLKRIKARPLWKKNMEGPDGKDLEWVALTKGR